MSVINNTREYTLLISAGIAFLAAMFFEGIVFVLLLALACILFFAALTIGFSSGE